MFISIIKLLIGCFLLSIGLVSTMSKGVNAINAAISKTVKSGQRLWFEITMIACGMFFIIRYLHN